MRFREIVDEVIRLAGDPEGSGSRRDNALAAYLQRLPEDAVFQLQVLMYFGRGDDPDIFALHEHLNDKAVTRHAADAIRTMIEKSPLAEYLARGLQMAEERGLDLEHLPKPGSIRSTETMH